jgi:hypothetical protein
MEEKRQPGTRRRIPVISDKRHLSILDVIDKRNIDQAVDVRRFLHVLLTLHQNCDFRATKFA